MDILDIFPDRIITEPNSGCWIWVGGVRCDKEPYGRLKLGTKFLSAHRYSYQLKRGEIPNGMHVLHKCDVMGCCNPDHLYLGDDAQNCRDRDSRGRHIVLRGEKHGCAKLTESAIREIRSLPKGKLPRGEATRLARQYGVCRTHIADIRSGRLWSHVV